MGRPPVPTHLKRDKRLVVMLTDEENTLFTEAARKAGAASVSDWVRDTLLTGEAIEIERNAWRFWCNELPSILGTETALTADRVQQIIDGLRNMDAKPDKFYSKMKPTEMEGFAKRSFLIYEAIGNTILARVMATKE